MKNEINKEKSMQWDKWENPGIIFENHKRLGKQKAKGCEDEVVPFWVIFATAKYIIKTTNEIGS